MQRLISPALILVLAAALTNAAEPGVMLLSDLARSGALTVRQGWGTLGLDTAAVSPDGRAPTPIRIADTVYVKGLGHHAPGEIRVALQAGQVRFLCQVGVQWQGGGRGSVILQVWVDDQKRFDSGVMSDSDAARPVDVALDGGGELRLVALDNGDGIACDMATWAEARFLCDPSVPQFGGAEFRLAGEATPASAAVCGLSIVARESGSSPQVAVNQRSRSFTAAVAPGEDAAVMIPLRAPGGVVFQAVAALVSGPGAEVTVAVGESRTTRAVATAPLSLEVPLPDVSAGASLCLRTRADDTEAGVRWSELRLISAGHTVRVPVEALPEVYSGRAPRRLGSLLAPVESELIEHDWQLQDGIEAPRRPASLAEAARLTLDRGERLLEHLRSSGTAVPEPLPQEWAAARAEQVRLETAAAAPGTWLAQWRRVHALRRRLVFSQRLAQTGPIAFVKQVPSVFSHQLTQYYGSCARPGGGVYVLDAPGVSMRCRRLAATALPEGSYQHLEVSYDGQRLLFAYCHAETAPPNREACLDRTYHLYEMAADGTGLRQLTDGPYDDIAPRYLPDGKLLFSSTRRGGFHRCGRGPCPVYALALAESDGSNPHPISFHETNEWDPAVLNDGRVIYTRWDYVDRHAVYYQQLWSVRQDGSDVRIFYGNNTFNPVGIWEARPVPGSRRVMATAAAHHAMTAGSIILLDPAMGHDGPAPITRLTPDALFPESETSVLPVGWHAPAGVRQPPAVPAEAERWPGHCYRTAYPLSETLFLAAYSYDPLIGEPAAPPPNMFGLYLVDAFGNKELLYRDPGISSLWPQPLRPRPLPPQLPSVLTAEAGKEGTFVLANVYDAWPRLPEVRIQRLRIVQVLPKATPHANAPPVGVANASPGKQTLGTVPVEADGSACFRAPAGLPLAFQALDERGQAVQVMRSLTYLQPGETVACSGCHEPRSSAAAQRSALLALTRPPSVIESAPDGARPLSYPLLVQPVLDKACVRCHSGAEPKGNVALTGTPEGQYSQSYNALVKQVPFSAWSDLAANGEPMTMPGRFGARASKLMQKLLAGHEDVTLSPADIERLATWMDVNALFYGTFEPAEQARQQRGERIDEPKLQ